MCISPVVLESTCCPSGVITIYCKKQLLSETHWPGRTCLKTWRRTSSFFSLSPGICCCPFLVEEFCLFVCLFPFQTLDLYWECSLVLRCCGFSVLESKVLGRIFLKNREFMFKALVETPRYRLFMCASGPWFHTYSAGPVDSSCTLYS